MAYNKKSLWKWILLYIVIAAIIYGAVYYFFFYKKGGYGYNAQSYQTQTQTKSSTDQTAGWKTYVSSEEKYSFKYPSSWRVVPNYVYSAAGAGGLVGYTITTSNAKIPSDNERIDIGGAQVDCGHLVSQDGQKHSPEGLCETKYPVYTFSTDPNVISVFNGIVNSIADIK